MLLLLKKPLQDPCSSGPTVVLAQGEREGEGIFPVFMKATAEMAVKMSSSRQRHTIIKKKCHADLVSQADFLSFTIKLSSLQNF